MPLIRIRDVGEDRAETNYVGEYSPECIVEPGDLLIGMDGDFNCARWHGPRGLLNQRVCRVVLTSDIYHPKLLDYALPGYLKAINDVTSSVTVKHLSSRTVAEIPLPLPPIRQQQKIVAEIEKQFSRLDEAVANLKRVKANLKRYKTAVLKAAVEGKLTEQWRKEHPDVEPASELVEHILAKRRAVWERSKLEKMAKSRASSNDRWKSRYKSPVTLAEYEFSAVPPTWVQLSLDSIANLITDGKHGDCRDEAESGYYFLSAKDVHDGLLDYSEGRQINRDEFMEVHYRTNLELNDVLITNAGTIGRVAIAKDKDKLPYTTFQKSVAIIKPVRPYVSSSFLAYYLESEVGKMQAKSAGTAVKNLLLSTLRGVRFCLPPMDEQSAIVAEVEYRLSMLEELEKEVSINLQRAERLRQSILGFAFSGKLVQQNADAESGAWPDLPLAAEAQGIYKSKK